MNKLNKTNYPKTDNMRYEMGQAFSKLIEKNISKELALNHSDHHILNERYD
jgi:DNA anti-recombination protein RmuC